VQAPVQILARLKDLPWIVEKIQYYGSKRSLFDTHTFRFGHSVL